MNTSSNMYQFHYAIKHTVRGGCGGGTGNGMAVVWAKARVYYTVQFNSMPTSHVFMLRVLFPRRNWICSIYDKLIWCDLILMVTIASLVWLGKKKNILRLWVDIGANSYIRFVAPFNVLPKNNTKYVLYMLYTYIC